MKNIVIGTGLTGAVIARNLAEKGESVLAIDRRNHIAGNVFDYKDSETGITVHKYGPHIFHTNNEEVWSFVNRFTDFYPFVFEPNVVIGGKPVTLPFNLTTLYQVFPEEKAKMLEEKLVSNYGREVKIPILELKNTNDKDLKALADFVYKNVFEGYTIKQWGLKPEEIDPTVTARVPIFISRDNRYFQDKHQGIPLNGYTQLVKNILEHPNIEIRLNTDYKEITENFDRTIYTGAIDEFFRYKFGELPYRSLNFDIKTENTEYYQNTAMVNYPNDFDFTRITEHKHFLNEKSSKTIISVEYPQAFVNGKNERYYPISNSQSQVLYEKYKQEALKIPNLYFAGRLGDYKYYNMDLAIERALKFCKEELK